MGDLLQLAIYNPAILKDSDFLAGFVARREIADDIIKRLHDITPRSLAKHRLILGQRGMGKTSLLRRLALAVRDDEGLARALLPLTFREEQYNVHNLHTFWCNCLDALGDHFERAEQHDKAAELDLQVAGLTRAKRRPASEDEGEEALATLKTWAKREGKRILLLIDNIDLILDGLAKQHWVLRRTLQEQGGIIVIGAATAYLEATSDPKGAFYDFFQVTVLERLTQDGLLACLRGLAEVRGEQGRKVLHILNTDPGRIRTLHDLTGGNLRTLVLLYMLLERDADDEVMHDLERLLDEVTVLYKARVEDLAPQARVVLDAVALNWNPVTAAKLAEITGMETSAVSTQLDRLVRNGLLEKVSISTSGRTAFQLGERFFNIWYLMRHGPRRQRTRLRWLTGFLRGFYSPQQLTEKAKSLLRRKNVSDQLLGHYCLALGDAIDNPDLRNLLGQEARRDLERLAARQGKRLEDIIDPKGLPTPTTAGEWYRMGWWLDVEWGRAAEAEAAYRTAIELDPKHSSAWNNLGTLLKNYPERFEEAESAYRRAIELDPHDANPWNNLGRLIRNCPGRIEEAESAYRRAIELNPSGAFPWNNLGNLLMEQFKRYQEAESAYRKAIELDPNYAFPWVNLGDLLTEHLGRYGEAESAYRKAIKLDPNSPRTWRRLGHLLRGHLGRYGEAESVYRKAIELDLGSTGAWNSLGNLLQDHLGRATEAIQAYQQSMELDPNNEAATANLAYLLLRNGTPEAAEPYYQLALSKLPPHGAALLRAYAELAQNNFGAAVAAFQEALESNHPDLYTDYFDDILRVLRLAANKNYGDKLLNWLDESGFADRYWPLRAAFDAYLHGETKLRDVNPEVGSAARRIYQWLTGTPPSSTVHSTDK